MPLKSFQVSNLSLTAVVGGKVLIIYVDLGVGSRLLRDLMGVFYTGVNNFLGLEKLPNCVELSVGCLIAGKVNLESLGTFAKISEVLSEVDFFAITMGGIGLGLDLDLGAMF